MKKIGWDLLFIVILTVFLVLLSKTGNSEVLIKLPFVTIYAAYLIGRLVGEFNGKKKSDNS
jgi:hypothetical protein